ncbi:MAG TPA: quinoprotein dehydrogenase-associated putative ABC transporter substrate-binding protein [Terriglobales bacterium]|nr:quinoprotein dehydrogenase-associated putative ABC transporter substrate-binding protein [Terriglobales bacterium]
MAVPLKVCADPDNLPYSNRASAGYENKIAELLARDLGRPLQYHWARLGRGFVREYLNQHECDLLIEVPAEYAQVLTTPPYFTSSYMFVTRESRKPKVTSFDDPDLRNFRIGVQTVADDYAPPAHALARRGLISNTVGFNGKRQGDGAIVHAVATGSIDLAVVWGPVAGYYSRKERTPLRLDMPPAFDNPSLPFRFSISMGVRKDDRKLRDEVAAFLIKRKFVVDAVLRRYGVPTVNLDTRVASIAR